jgi:beta-glucosidase
MSYHGVVDLSAGQPIPITVEYATSDSLGGAELHLGWQPPEPKLQAKAVRAARRADAAIVFVNDVTSEGMDRTSLSLPGDQDDLIRAVAKANPHTVVVLHTASAVLMPWRNKVAAIVEAWYPGQQSGDAIAQTLFGDVDPSGRLPVTFPASETQNPTVSPPDQTTGPDNVVEFSEGLEVGYRYYDANGKKPLYPFGFGLSYTSFKLSGLKVKPDGSGAQKVSVRVENTGRRAGTQVVQAYVGFPSGAGEPPRQLKAFAKVSLKSGQEKTVKMRLDPSSFEIFDEGTGSWTTPTGRYRIYVGISSRDLPVRTSVDVG